MLSAPKEFTIQLERKAYNKDNNEINGTNRGISDTVWKHRGSRDGHFRMSQMSNCYQALPKRNLLCDPKMSTFRNSAFSLGNKGESTREAMRTRRTDWLEGYQPHTGRRARHRTVLPSDLFSLPAHKIL